MKTHCKRAAEPEGLAALAWTYGKNTPYVPSPLLYNGRLCYLRGNDERLS